MRRTLRWSQLRIGVFATATVLLFALAIFFVDRLGDVWEYRYRLHIYAESARNLAPGSPVWLAGVAVGRVWNIEFRGPESPLDRRIEIEARLRRGVAPLITQGAIVRVVTAGLLGEAVLEITPPTEDTPPIPERSALAAGAPVDFPEVAAKLQAVRTLLPETLGRLAAVRDRAARSPHLAAIRRDGSPWTRVFTDLREIELWLAEERGTLARLADDPRLFSDLARVGQRLATLADAAASSDGSLGRLADDTLLAATLAEAGRRIARLERALGEGHGTAGRLLYDRELWMQWERTLLELQALRRIARPDERRAPR